MISKLLISVIQLDTREEKGGENAGVYQYILRYENIDLTSDSIKPFKCEQIKT